MEFTEPFRAQEEEQEIAPQSWVGVVLAIWLTGVFMISLLGKLDTETGRSFGMELLAGALVWPLAYFAVSRNRFVPYFPPIGASLALATFVVFCGLSSIVSRAGYESIGYTALTAVTFWIVLQFNTNLTTEQVERGLKLYAGLMAVLLVGFAVYYYVPGSRLGLGKSVLNPNAVALVAMSPFLAAMAIRLLPLRLVVMGVLGTVIVLTGSRAAAVASLAGVLVVYMVRLRQSGTRGLGAALVCLLIGMPIAAYCFDPLIRAVDQFFVIHDRYRGLESGASGRFETWAVVWDLFLSNPVIGVGFRAHESLLKVNTSAHNGYLALLAEIGLVGFAGALYLTLSGLHRAWRRMKMQSENHTMSVLVGFSCGFFALAMFERYFINVGNPTSLLFLLSILSPAVTSWHVSEKQETPIEGLEPPPHDLVWRHREPWPIMCDD